MRKILVPFVVLTLLFVLTIPVLAGGQIEAAGRPAVRLAHGWTQMLSPVSPSPRNDATLAYDTARGVAVLFGGGDNGIELDDTWEWDSVSMSWVEREPVHKPAPRYGYGMAYDEVRGVTVLFGGEANAAEFGDTWLWDGEDWTEVWPAASPSPRWLNTMVYDSARQRVVLFGGEPSDYWYSDETWEWDGVNWVLQDIASPSPRFGVGLAYDSRRGVTVLFAGDDGVGWQSFNDTWERAGSGDWVQLDPSRHPSRRSRMTMAYSPQLRRTLLFGGLEGGQWLTDTYAWNGVQWQQANPVVHPSESNGGMVYDPVNKALLLYVGDSIFGQNTSETWYFR
ncbi:MAG: hypothetical protein AB1791_12380 [Chloroflexota bacterium]